MHFRKLQYPEATQPFSRGISSERQRMTGGYCNDELFVGAFWWLLDKQFERGQFGGLVEWQFEFAVIAFIFELPVDLARVATHAQYVDVFLWLGLTIRGLE